MDSDHDPWADSATETLPRDFDADIRRPAPLAAQRPDTPATRVGRGLLRLLLVILAPLALIVWAVLPRVTSPALLADQAVESGLTSIVRDGLVDQLSSELSERRGSPAQSEQMRSVFERSVTQAWLDEQVMIVAAELDEWFAGTDDRPPELVVDLTPVKASLAADPEALFLVADLVGAEQVDGSVAVALAGVPDRVELFSEETESEFPEGAYTVREVMATARTARQMIPVTVLLVFALFVLLARAGQRLRSGGRTLLAVGIPLLIASLLMPMVASWLAVDAMSDLPIDAADLESFLSWMFEPVRPVGFVLLTAGLAAVIAAFMTDLLRRRSS